MLTQLCPPSPFCFWLSVKDVGKMKVNDKKLEEAAKEAKPEKGSKKKKAKAEEEEEEEHEVAAAAGKKGQQIREFSSASRFNQSHTELS
jgi:hypothetical protein